METATGNIKLLYVAPGQFSDEFVSTFIVASTAGYDGGGRSTLYKPMGT